MAIRKNTLVGCASVALVGGAVPVAGDECLDTLWCDSFDDYTAGVALVGQDCGGILGCPDDPLADCAQDDFNWEGWDLNPASAGALVSTSFAANGANSVEVKSSTTDDLVHTFGELAIGPTGAYRFSTYLYVPTGSTGSTYLILLNTYTHSGSKNWSLQVEVDADIPQLRADNDGETLPLTLDAWVLFEVDIDLDNNRQIVRYGGAVLYDDTWTERVSGGGQLSIEAFNFYSNDASPMYLDEMKLCRLFLSFEAPEEFLASGEALLHDIGNIDTAQAPGPSDSTQDVAVVVPGDDPGLPGAMEVFINQGTNMSGGWLGLVPNDTIGTGRDPSGVALGLFDPDPYLDAAVTNAGDDNVFIYFGDGSGLGTFLPPTPVATGDEPRAIAAGDFDGDLDIDLAVANAADQTIYLLSNDGLGNFALTLVIPGGVGMVRILPDDFDNDKDLDLVVAQAGEATVGVHFLEGGGLVSSQTLDVGLVPLDIATGDFDGNDSQDIVSSNNGDATLSVLLNDGGTFDPPVTLNVGNAPRSVDAADFDNDLDPDLVIAVDDGVIGPAVQVLVNRTNAGGLLFSPPVAYGVDADPNFVATTDLDNDGRADIVTSNADDGGTGGSVTALLATAPEEATCSGDVDGDGAVGFLDIVQILGEWGPYTPCPPHKPADLDSDCEVTFLDLLIVLGAWGPC